MTISASKSLNALVERQMRNWEIGKEQAPTDAASPPAVRPFVTISRMVGCGGDEVAASLADKSGWPLFDREVLQYMAGDDDVRRRLYETMDERDTGFIEDTLRTFTSTEMKRNDYFHRLTETILAIARQSNALFLGRGADLILPRKSGLRIRMVGDFAPCAAHYAQVHKLSDQEARSELKKREEQTTHFIEQHFKVGPDKPDRFDMVLNMTNLTVPEATGIIAEAMRLRGYFE